MLRFRLFEDLDSILNSFINNNNKEPRNPMGTSNTEKGNDKNGDWYKETFTSDDGMFQFTTLYRPSGKHKPKENLSEINKLETMLHKAIEEQEFELAVEYRDKINILKLNKDKISELKKNLNIAIQDQDYEKAILIRDELKKIK